MAVVEGGKPRIIENKEGNRTTPSMVALSKKGERLVGILAKRQAITNPDNTIFSVKRLIGRRFQDGEIQRAEKLVSYQMRESKNGLVEVKLGDKWYTPQEISAMILQKLKNDAEDRLGDKIDEVVITVPAYFDDSQRKATKEAGEVAGLKVRRILNEPTAAALAYGLEKKKDEKIVVYDFGGGTFDISVLEVTADTIEVKSTGGDTHLGGDDFDNKIIEWIIEEFKKEEGIDLAKDPLAMQRLKDAAERAKHELSSTLETEINIPFITTTADGPKHLDLKLSRSKFELMVSEYVDRSIKLVEATVKDAKLAKQDIDEIILVGGQTRMPAIQEAVKKFFGKEPHKDINPDEVVALGAAIQGGIFQGEVKDVLLLDVTPLTLGIETLGGVATPLIEKNTTIPTRKSQVFSTASDSQTTVEIHVVQGERPMATDNKSLGRFHLTGIPPAPRGVPQIEVTFDIDANGILSVTAQDKATGKKQSIRIEGSTGLSQEEIERMRKDAEAHAEEDRRKKELVEVRNLAEGLINTTEKTLKEAADKVSDADKKEIKKAIEDLKKVKDGDDAGEIKSKTEVLSQAVQKLGAELYRQQASKDDAGKGADDGKEDKKSDDSKKDKDPDDAKDKQ